MAIICMKPACALRKGATASLRPSATSVAIFFAMARQRWRPRGGPGWRARVVLRLDVDRLGQEMSFLESSAALLVSALGLRRRVGVAPALRHRSTTAEGSPAAGAECGNLLHLSFLSDGGHKRERWTRVSRLLKRQVNVLEGSGLKPGVGNYSEDEDAAIKRRRTGGEA